jgi:hypothetical protein
LIYYISEELVDTFPSLMVADFRERLSVIKRATQKFDMER